MSLKFLRSKGKCKAVITPCKLGPDCLAVPEAESAQCCCAEQLQNTALSRNDYQATGYVHAAGQAVVGQPHIYLAGHADTQQPPYLAGSEPNSNSQSLWPTLLKDSNPSIPAMLQAMLSDSNPMVVANAVAALAEIQDFSGRDVFRVDSDSLFKLLRAINECTEWGQVSRGCDHHA